MIEDHFKNLQPGTTVNGRYEVVKSLGQGSMGMVYACRDRELGGRLVAMKVLFSEVAQDDVATKRFKNEIFASYSVNHPNVVRAYEYFTDRDLIAYTMEYVGGGDLAERIGADEPIPIAQIVRMLSQMCCGVQSIHQEGIIHRDLKPENILLTSQGDIKITDFGIARTGSGPKLTEHGGVVGTIDYVSPEYLEIGQVDARSDIYAMGVLGYEMITGKAPFQGQSVIETMTMRLRTDPRPPADLRADCPVRLSDIILMAMKRSPEERYQKASDMLRDLDELSGQMRSGMPDRGNLAPVRMGGGQAPFASNARPPYSPGDSGGYGNGRGEQRGGYGANYPGNQQGQVNQPPVPQVMRPPMQAARPPQQAYAQPPASPPHMGYNQGPQQMYPEPPPPQRRHGGGPRGGSHSPSYDRNAGSGNYGRGEEFHLNSDTGDSFDEGAFELFASREDYDSGASENKGSLSAHPNYNNGKDRSEIDLALMARSQRGDINEEEEEGGFIAQVFFYLFIVFLGLALGLGLSFFYLYSGGKKPGNILPSSLLPSNASFFVQERER